MTEVQKEILIAKMLDNPSCLSDEELEIILHDDEMKDIYEMSADVSGSIRQSHLIVDMDDEWDRFNSRMKRKSSPMRWMTKVAAILSGLIIISGITIFFLDRPQSTNETAVVDNTALHATIENTLQSNNTNNISNPELSEKDITPSVSPQNTPIAVRKVSHAKPKAKPDIIIDDAEIDEYLRIQQASIDNEIALQAAEIIKDEYEALLPYLDAAGAYNAKMDKTIARITMP